MAVDIRTSEPRRSHRSIQASQAPVETAPRLRRFCFGVFLASALIVLFFLAFNYSVPALKDRVDPLILDRVSLMGARVYPIALVMTGLSYLGIIVTARRATPRQSKK